MTRLYCRKRKIETHVSNFFNIPTGSSIRVDFDQIAQSGYCLLDVVDSVDVIELDDRTRLKVWTCEVPTAVRILPLETNVYREVPFIYCHV